MAKAALDSISSVPRVLSNSPSAAVSRRALSGWSLAIHQALPIMLAYFTISIAFGLSAKELGFPAPAAILMSAFVYAGASQMIALGLLASGEPFSAIVFSTLIVNVRLLLLSTAIAPHMERWSGLKKFLFSTELTDETFTLLSSTSTEEGLSYRHSMQVQIAAHIAWIAGTIVGIEFNHLVGDTRPYGMDFALIGLLLGMACIVIKNSRQVLVGAFSGAVALIAFELNLGTFGLPIAAIAGPTFGVWLEKKWR